MEKPRGFRTESGLKEHLGRNKYLPPYSPDFNPIEKAFSKLKAFLRKAAARTVDDLWQAIADALNIFSPRECQNDFAACGYDCE